MLSVTTGDMLQRPAAYKQLWSVLMSGPGYGDRCVKSVQEQKRVIDMCFVALGNETPGPGPAGIMTNIQWVNAETNQGSSLHTMTDDIMPARPAISAIHTVPLVFFTPIAPK